MNKYMVSDDCFDEIKKVSSDNTNNISVIDSCKKIINLDEKTSLKIMYSTDEKIIKGSTPDGIRIADSFYLGENNKIK